MSRKPRTTKAALASNPILEAISFAGAVLSEKGEPAETHLFISNKWAVAFNGVLAAGCPIELDLFAAPNYYLLSQALSKCGQDLEIIAQGQNLLVKSGKFKAIVPCIDPSILHIGSYDGAIAPINDEFKVALAKVAPLVSETGQRIYDLSILMNGASLISSEQGSIIFEAWHGIDLPTNIAFPKALVAPLTKTTKKLKGFGCSEHSITFHFEDGSFIKSQLFSDKWPIENLNGILNNAKPTPTETPKNLWDALSAIAPFSSDGLCYFDTNYIRSSNNEAIGAAYQIDGLPRGPVFSIKQLNTLKDHIKQVDFFCHGPNGVMTYFYGDKCRGVIAGRTDV